MNLRVEAPVGPIEASIDLPTSKSISNRLLIIQALGGGSVNKISDADDTIIMQDLLSEKPAIMHCGLGGTTLRFLLAWAAMQDGHKYQLTGQSELLGRPHTPLVDALLDCGADIEKTENGFLVSGKTLLGGKVVLENIMSSQYVSALLLIAPYMERVFGIRWKGEQISRPYVDMTISLMREAGVQVEETEDRFIVEPGTYMRMDRAVPKDWSAAAFFYMLTAGQVNRKLQLQGLFVDGLQGDESIAAILETSVHTRENDEGTVISGSEDMPDGPHFDLKATPDLFPPLAFLMATENRACTFQGLDNLSLKESDRLGAVAALLEQLGASVSHDGNSFRIINGVTEYDGKPLSTFNDHRLAMGLVKLADRFPYVTIADAHVVEKSFPRFWDELAGIGYQLETIP